MSDERVPGSPILEDYLVRTFSPSTLLTTHLILQILKKQVERQHVLDSEKATVNR
jgi:hypothetical protein